MQTCTRARLIGEIAREIAGIFWFQAKNPVLCAAALAVMAVELAPSGEEAVAPVSMDGAREDQDKLGAPERG